MLIYLPLPRSNARGGWMGVCVCGKGMLCERMSILCIPPISVCVSVRKANAWHETRYISVCWSRGVNLTQGRHHSTLAQSELHLTGGVKQINKRSHTHSHTLKLLNIPQPKCFIIMTSARGVLVHHYPFSKFLFCLAVICSNPQ